MRDSFHSDLDLTLIKRELEGMFDVEFELGIDAQNNEDFEGNIFIYTSRVLDLTIWIDENVLFIGNLKVYDIGNGFAKKIINFLIEYISELGFEKITATRIMDDGDSFWPHMGFYKDFEDYSYDL